MMYDARSSPAKATVTADAAGRVTVRTATCDQGTGSRTILAQMAADAVGVGVDRVTVEVGDTDQPMAPISAGSMTTASVGTAVTRAAADLRTQLLLTAVSHERSPMRGRPVDAVHLGDDVSVATIVGWVGQPVVGHGTAAKIGEAEGVSRFSFGAHFAEVRVSATTGEVRVSRHTAGFAAGRIINPRLAHSQLLGGIVMGIGMALHEATHVDPATGRIATANLADYLVPTHADVGAIIDAFFRARGRRPAGEPDRRQGRRRGRHDRVGGGGRQRRVPRDRPAGAVAADHAGPAAVIGGRGRVRVGSHRCASHLRRCRGSTSNHTNARHLGRGNALGRSSHTKTRRDEGRTRAVSLAMPSVPFVSCCETGVSGVHQRSRGCDWTTSGLRPQRAD